MLRAKEGQVLSLEAAQPALPADTLRVRLKRRAMGLTHRSAYRQIMLNKPEAIAKLRRQIDLIPELKKKRRFSPEFKKWRRDTQVVIQNAFGEETRHIKDFDNISYSFSMFTSATPDYEFEERFHQGLDEAVAALQSFVDEISEYWGDRPTPAHRECLPTIEHICIRFHLAVRQIRSRHGNRETLNVEDEYDVQDLLHTLLTIEFDDIRPEEWTPSYAGSSSRMDFLLKQEQTVIEVKRTRAGLGAKELGEQLIVDIQRYQAHPDCRTLVCFVYDPEGRIANPRGIENDLSGEKDGLAVKVIIAPKGM